MFYLSTRKANRHYAELIRPGDELLYDGGRGCHFYSFFVYSFCFLLKISSLFLVFSLLGKEQSG